MCGKRKDNYEEGDQVHFILTDDFVETYNKFIEYCNKNSINASSAIRTAIKNWLEIRKREEEEIERMNRSRASFESSSRY